MRITPHGGKKVYLGLFDDELDASFAYDEAAKLLHPGRARFNHSWALGLDPELTEEVRAILRHKVPLFEAL